MATYFEVNNDNNTLQLNDSWENISFLRKQTVSDWKKINGDRWRCILSLIERPVFWFVYNNSNFPVDIIFFSNKDKGKLSRKFDFILPNGTNTQPSIEFYLFGFKENQAASTKGLELYNSNGRRIYSSEEKYLKIIHTFLPGEVDNDYRWNAPTGKKIAVHATGLPTILKEDTGAGFSTFSQKGIALGPKNSYVGNSWNTEFGPDLKNESDIYEETLFKSMWTIADITGL